MIEIYGTRNRGTEFFNNCPSPYQTSVENALVQMVKFEFGYGGNAKKVINDDENVTIVTETFVLNCKDTTYFRGSKHEIQPLLEACMFWCLSIGRDPIHTDIAIDELTDKNEISKYSTLLTTMTLPILIGTSRVKGILAYACGLDSEEDFKAAMKLQDKDIPSAVSLWKELGEGKSFAEFSLIL